MPLIIHPLALPLHLPHWPLTHPKQPKKVSLELERPPDPGSVASFLFVGALVVVIFSVDV